jgi:hypothetical protein
LEFSGEALIERGFDTTGTILGVWLLIVAAVSPVLWLVHRRWGNN